MRATPAMMLMIAADLREVDRRNAAAGRAARGAAWVRYETADRDAAAKSRSPGRRWRPAFHFRALASKGNV